MAQDILLNYLTAGKDPIHATGLQDEFSQRLAAMLGAAPNQNVSIYSGFRSNERQAQLYEAALQKYGSPEAARKWVAPPGRSQHNHGLAADLRYGDDAAKAWVHENAANFGLNFRMAHEPWHIEMIGGKPVVVPDAPADGGGGAARRAPPPGGAPPPGPQGLEGLLAASFGGGGGRGGAPAFGPAPTRQSASLPAGTGNIRGQNPQALARILEEMQTAASRALPQMLG